MRILFCSDPLAAWRPEPMYEVEVLAAQEAGLSYALVSFEALVDEQNAARAVRRVEAMPEPELAIYRGWMLKPEAYARLYQALSTKNIYLINSPAAYTHCHYLPASYALIEPYTPRSIWLEGRPDIQQIMSALRVFGDGALILKDFVKSRKHEWDQACYIPHANDQQAVERVVTRFLELQGEDLNGGLVFRQFVEFEPLARHTKSGMPLSQEFRLFFCDGSLLAQERYWNQGDYSAAILPIERFSTIASTIHSRFFTMDVARQRNGDWLIVELGDAQVAGLPEGADVQAFYRHLTTINSSVIPPDADIVP